MLKLGETKVTKKSFMLQKKTIEIWDVKFDNIVISILLKTKAINFDNA